MSTAFQVSLTAYRRIAPTAITNSEVPIVIRGTLPGTAREKRLWAPADLDSAWIRGGVIGSPPGFGPGRGGSNPPPGTPRDHGIGARVLSAQLKAPQGRHLPLNRHPL